MLYSFIKKQDTNMRAIIPIDKAIAIALHRSGYRDTLYMIGHHLGNSPSISSKFTITICKVLITYFYNRYIQIPKDEALQKFMASFKSLTRISYM